MENRSLNAIATEIGEKWLKINYAAKPYWEAMFSLKHINDVYGCETGKVIVLYFLSNATTWKGEDAKRIKLELKKMIK
jgi:hypothetical protein